MGGAQSVRGTADIDLLVVAETYSKWSLVLARFRAQGFVERADSSKRCALVQEELEIDIVATPWDGVGANRWYADAWRARVLDKGTGLHVIPPLWFLATKLVAFSDRGTKDPLVSVDLDDIVTVLNGADALWSEIETGTDNVHRTLRFEPSTLGMRDDDVGTVVESLVQDNKAFTARLRALAKQK